MAFDILATFSMLPEVLRQPPNGRLDEYEDQPRANCKTGIPIVAPPRCPEM
jgi:hypothetical protein